MRVEPIVLLECLPDVRDELDATCADAIPQVPTAEGAQRQLGLVDPGCMRRREVKHHTTSLCGHPRLGLLRNVRGAVVENAVNAPDRPGHGGHVLVHAIDEVAMV